MGVIALAGDSMMQAIESNCQAYDAQRTGRFVLFRLAFSAPYYTAWYQLLELAFPTAVGARSLGAVLSKTLLDCVVSTPVQHLAFFSSQAAWEGQPDGVQRALAVLPRSVPTSWAFWAPVQLVTFGVVPLHLRVLFMNSVSVIWNAVLSGLNEQARRS